MEPVELTCVFQNKIEASHPAFMFLDRSFGTLTVSVWAPTASVKVNGTTLELAYDGHDNGTETFSAKGIELRIGRQDGSMLMFHRKSYDPQAWDTANDDLAKFDKKRTPYSNIYAGACRREGRLF